MGLWGFIQILIFFFSSFFFLLFLSIFRHVKHGINKCEDDFLGQVIVPLDKIEAAAVTEEWYRLQRGTTKVMASQVTGKLHLKMHYVRKEVRFFFQLLFKFFSLT